MKKVFCLPYFLILPFFVPLPLPDQSFDRLTKQVKKFITIFLDPSSSLWIVGSLRRRFVDRRRDRRLN